MMRSLYSGVSGLRTHQTRMDVIGNNIANVNTVAFKSSAVTFNDIMYQTTQGASQATDTKGGVNAKQIGLGVATGSTKISITSGGASESTGNAFDIKLTDSNTTNFFIVNSGSDTLFTRAGSFYVDGNGNLAMTSTGYLVQGWQVDPQNPSNIIRDTVSPLRIMSPENMTSEPEATTNATVSGVIDKNDTNVTSDKGYLTTLNFYDSLGYSYTARFYIKAEDRSNPTNGRFTVGLESIVDSNNQDVLARYVAQKIDEAKYPNGHDQPAVEVDEIAIEKEAIATVFGAKTDVTDKITLNSGYNYVKGAPSTITFTDSIDNATYTLSLDNAQLTEKQSESGVNQIGYNFTPDRFVSLADLFGVGADTLADYGITTAAQAAEKIKLIEPDYIDYTSPYLAITHTEAVGTLSYNTADGTFQQISVGENAGPSTIFNLEALDNPAFRNITVDFSKTMNYDNGGKSTVGAEKGSPENSAIGYGKKLGVLTGVSVDGSGRIYGSYDNGNTALLGQIAVAQFANASGLESLGNNVYGTTLNSGDFDGIGKDVTADGGSMATGQLEMSNVDLSQEFTTMITTQRGFQANSRIITVSDTMLEELTNLKR